MNVNIRKKNWSEFVTFYPKFWIPIIPSKYLDQIYEFNFENKKFTIICDKNKNLKIISSYCFLTGYNFSKIQQKLTAKDKLETMKSKNRFIFKISYICCEKFCFIFLWNNFSKPIPLLNGGDVFGYDDAFILHQKLDICLLRVILKIC